jgi:hypothetical protein
MGTFVATIFVIVVVTGACTPAGGDDLLATEAATATPRQLVGVTPAPVKATSKPRPTKTPKPVPVVYYANCSEARAAGATPIHRGEPGYRSGLDRDNDGIACE